jgi:hypothetical protein
MSERMNSRNKLEEHAILEGDNLRRRLDEVRHHKIEEAAYFKAEHRGFVPGHELEDWMEAQQEIDEASRPLPSY